MAKKQQENVDATIGSLLTRRQARVLKLRFQGLSQKEVADLLSTTRPNISILENRAHQNIERARCTIQHWMMIMAPVHLYAYKGTDVFSLPAMAFDAADKKGIKLPITSTDVLIQLKMKSPMLFEKPILSRDVEIFITRDGEILISDEGWLKRTE